jgi:myo-inositol-1-phosphate synthase
MSKSNKIKVGIIGVGNCAKSLVEGVQYYSEKQTSANGMMREDIGGYKAENIEFVCGFDIDERKVNTPLGEALKQRPNSAYDIVEKINSKAPVYEAPVIDGYALLMDSYPEKDRFLVSEKLRNSSEMNRTSWTKSKEQEWKERIINYVNKHEVEVLVNYLPVGSQKATEFWAEVCLATGVSFVNCIPVFIASNPTWEKRFIDAGIPIVGDDMRSQFGASILSQMLQELAFERGHDVKAHIQRNVGGNTDFLNMEDKGRLQSKKISKENVIRAQNDIRGISTEDSFLHAGPSEYIAYYGDNKVANFRLELEGFGGAPVLFDAQLSVQDSPNSAGVVIDALRYVRVAREMGIVGALRGPSAFTQKTPPKQMMFADAVQECEALANRKLTPTTKKQVVANKVSQIRAEKEKVSKN